MKLQKNSENSEQCRKIQNVFTANIHKKCREIQLIQKNSENVKKFRNCRIFLVIQKNSNLGAS
jgi:hypothetical protein